MKVFTERRLVTVVRWAARMIGIALLGLVAALAIGEGGVPGAALWTMLIGQVVAWKREGIGGFLILGGFALFAIVNHPFRLNIVFGSWLVTGLLYSVCWWRTPKTIAA
jgi:hypothetical protein